jgi:hypothetical protein
MTTPAIQSDNGFHIGVIPTVGQIWQLPHNPGVPLATT